MLTLDQLSLLDHTDLASWVKPRPVDQERGDLMVQAAVATVREAVRPRTVVPDLAKFVVLEVAARAYTPRVQQESLGSRSVSYFPPGDPRTGVFLTDEDLKQLGVSANVTDLGMGVAWTPSPGGAAGWTKSPTQTGKWPWSSDGVPL